MQEVWKPVSDYEGYYEVSNYGNVRSVDRIVKVKNYYRPIRGRVLKHVLGNSGYLFVRLSKGNKVKQVDIHRLVALAFIANPNNYIQVNHKDENKLNNRVDNLEWCSASYNINYGTRNERSSLKNSKPINQYDKQGKLINTYSSILDAGKQFSSKSAFSNISKAVTGKYKSAYGYVWKYVKEEDK